MSKVYVIATICQNKKKIDKKIETNNYPPPKKTQTNKRTEKKQKTPQKREQNSQNLIFSLHKYLSNCVKSVLFG